MFYHVTNARGVMIAVNDIPTRTSPIRCTCSSWVGFSLVYGSHTERHIQMMVELGICMHVL